jgi:hypothetical protein
MLVDLCAATDDAHADRCDMLCVAQCARYPYIRHNAYVFLCHARDSAKLRRALSLMRAFAGELASATQQRVKMDEIKAMVSSVWGEGCCDACSALCCCSRVVCVRSVQSYICHVRRLRASRASCCRIGDTSR